ncbi:methylated-DNA--[protein]-cysteine S-methyltransferase [Conexibacter sp. JD483]|uniref:methylated-DNA--[protein]-cysteine S-methyltransferase n=1 Tax=unclassified Conexibacter TaxID=2627773 RepID=UPI0027160FD8|nr:MULTISPECIES: methylated-DNA--[protein]-cysteine S-methyltransferase [unclassified Conexibacter]MDO8186259.1 methylated-DNA--[protein]-cysteine S-methyltransferase [Conexibacter sp. CPCC 205706]MDO8199674.1 methylated-DNA--[protein]-cysteine S-methyltransferase [Conexibacter sp. CPCC 205762]MDR9372496.1 methylated-DNA--[protein]-cysteine S-methyltransferase [Conexibacter sp. JD483]
MTLVTTTIPTPPGPFTVIARESADGTATVLASGWAPGAAALLETIGPARLAGAGVAGIDPRTIEQRDDLGPITQALRDYLAGDLHAIDAVAVEQAGAPFTARAWQQLRAIPAGEPRTYAQLAASSGNPSAVRAAGSACGRNTAALFVPCHRVLRTGGDLGGFLYGLDVKRWLLEHEAAPAAVA